MRKIFTIALVIAGFLISCDHSERDIMEPRLPRYTEQGANTAGCIINEKVWFDPCYFSVSDSWTTCSGLTVARDTLLNFSDLRLSGGYYKADLQERESVNLVFRIPGRQIRNLSGLQALIGAELPIDGISVSADLLSSGASLLSCDEAEILQTGKIFFRSGGPKHEAFAGTFGFSTSSDCGKYDVFYGRFDYSLAKVNFVSLN